MTRNALLAGGAIVALGFGAVLFIESLGEGGPGPSTRPPDDPAANSPPLPRPAPPADVRASRAALAQLATPESGPTQPVEPPPPLPPAPPPASWASVEIANPHGAGSLGPAINAALGKLKPQLAECFSRPGQARYAQLGSAASKLPGGNAPRHVGPAIVLLSLEGDGHQLTVVDAPVESRGAASDGTLNCAQAKLRGAKLGVETEGPIRMRFRFVLRP